MSKRIFGGVVGGGDLRADVDGSKWTTYDGRRSLRQRFTYVGASGDPHTKRNGEGSRFEPATASMHGRPVETGTRFSA